MIGSSCIQTTTVDALNTHCGVSSSFENSSMPGKSLILSDFMLNILCSNRNSTDVGVSLRGKTLHEIFRSIGETSTSFFHNVISIKRQRVNSSDELQLET